MTRKIRPVRNESYPSQPLFQTKITKIRKTNIKRNNNGLIKSLKNVIKS